ncbi:MAG: alpha/beta fold hydrolase [Pseudomonadota bacterium]
MPRLAWSNWGALALGLALTLLTIWQIEAARPDVAAAKTLVGTTPVTEWRQDNAIATVVVAHGFAGSRPLMTALNWTLVRNGYDVVAFDFEGHGVNPVPMSGATDSIEGTTRRLVDETRRVMAHAGAAPALLGHSMATDVLIRAALEEEAGPIIAISPFSGAVTPEHPRDLLLIAGEWEGRLIAFGREAITQLDSAAEEGAPVGGEINRMALIAPRVEHVGILFSPFVLEASVRWLDAAYGIAPREPAVAAIGYYILLLLAAIMLLWWPLAKLLPRGGEAQAIPLRAFWWCVGFSIFAPVAVFWIDLAVLPVLVADYLVLHLGFTGTMHLLILRHFGVGFGRLSVPGFAALLVWGIAVFGLAIDTYAANFHPNLERTFILLALALGAVPFMAADAIATQGGKAALWRRVVLRGAFFVSLALAVSLDFERLFFLILIAPIILLFFLIFGLMGRWTAARTGPLSPGLALGLILAWALGVTFPLFQA